MPSWSDYSGTGDSLVAASDALATALGITSAGDCSNMVCTKNEVTGVWTCVMLVFDPAP